MAKASKSPTVDRAVTLLRRRLKAIEAERRRLEQALVDLGRRRRRP